jgi:1,5-anhydro-D-fructose reductase (1,5-anhydro-D-mannitol-forming)
MQSKVRLGIIGLGAMGTEFLQAAEDHPDVVVVAASDLDEARLDLAKKHAPDASVSSDAQNVIANANVDGVIVATPPDAHARWAISALEARKSVLCEKPLAASLEDGERMLVAARQFGGVNLIHFPFCDRLAVLHIEKALRSGELGRVGAVDVRLLFPIWPREFQKHALWINSRSQGGAIREVFSHFAYLTDRLLGPLALESVRMAGPSPHLAENYVSADFTAGSANISLRATTNIAAAETYEWVIYGDRASYRLSGWRKLEKYVGDDWETVELSGEPGTEKSRLTEFARAVRGEPTRLPDFETGLRVQKIIEACHGNLA